MRLPLIFCALLLPLPAIALPSVVKNGSTLTMSNVNVVVQYDLSTGKADFLWQNSLKIDGFYAGVGSGSYYHTGKSYASHSYSSSSNTVIVTSADPVLPLLKQYFILDQDNSFLTRAEVDGTNLSANWMGPVVVDTSGYVDIGSYGDPRALYVPFDNDSFTRYNAMPLNSTGRSYEVAAFYDNVTRNGLVVGSVTHDTWKTGIYFVGSSNRLINLNVYGGANSSQTRDTMPHGSLTGSTLTSPTVYVGFGTDWRATMESFADANTAFAPRLAWSGGVPFGWNSWYGLTTNINYSKAIAVSDFIRNNLQTNNFNNSNAVYVNLDSYWSNLSDSELLDFVNHCHTNGQKAGLYLAPFAWFNTPSAASNVTVQGSSYKYAQIALRDGSGNFQIIDGAIALDPTHPGLKQRLDYYFNKFTTLGIEYIKLDFLTHGALEGIHYDTNIATGIQAYNQGMQYILNQSQGRMFISESIAPIFPYNYAHSRRIACDTSTHISETEYQMENVTYGWWMSGRLYQYNDPDCMKFAGATTNENQSRAIACAISGTVFLNSDDLTSTTNQALAQACLTNLGMNGVAQAGRSFTPIEGNTGTNAAGVFVRQDGTTWSLAAFNYSANSVITNINLSRAGIFGNYIPVDLWSGATVRITNSSLSLQLNAKQSRLFRLFTPPTLISSHAGSNGIFNAILQGDAGHIYALQKTTDWVNWNTVDIQTNLTGQLQFTEPGEGAGSGGFFRSKLVR